MRFDNTRLMIAAGLTMAVCGFQAAACPVPDRPVATTSRMSAMYHAQVTKELFAVPPQPGEGTKTADEGKTIVGLWEVVVKANGQVIDMAFESFGGDGSEISIDIAPPARGNVCLGTWKIEKGSVVVKHPFWSFDDAGMLNGRGLVTSKIDLGKNRDTFTGTAKLEVRSLTGAVLVSLDLTIEGKRITTD
jgi:hypothetical protein